MATPKTILIVGMNGTRIPEPIANETILPGCLIQHVGKHTDAISGMAAATLKVGLQASAGGYTYPLFALEADYVGTPGEATQRIDHAYVSGDHVHAYAAERGARIYAFLASGQNVSVGQLLQPAAAGQLRAAVNATGIAIAVEAVNASSAASRIVVEVI
jgi:hypothetical protein